MFESLTIPPHSGSITVSIIIPVYNNVSLSHQCLKAIIEHTSPHYYEVIVVDNASTDGTDEMLNAVQGEIRVIRNETNLGFGEACNQGASVARGAYLLFLNNDVIVRPNWLCSLVDTIGSFRDVGAVGSKLLFADGSLQEAGGIVFGDGTASHYGRNDDPAKPQYNYVREVDYCSAACLLVQKKPFDQLGGFDPIYSPAYYEDTHLCFELRRLGYRVFYQPLSEVIHLEGKTAGTDPSAHFKRYMALNQKVFFERQKKALAAQTESKSKNFFRARDRRNGLRILIIDDGIPKFDSDSGSARRTLTMKLLVDEGHRLTFLPEDLHRVSPYTEHLQQMGVEVLYGKIDIHDYLRAHAPEFDVIIVGRATVAIKYLPFLRTEFPNAKIVFDTVDLHYLRGFRQSLLLREPEALRKNYIQKQTELFLCRLSSSVWVVSDTERDLLLGEDPRLSVSIVPNVHIVRREPAPVAGRRDIMIIGGFGHPHNRDAVIYFAEEIFPLLLMEIPGLKFYIVGSSPTPDILQLASDRIYVTGYVKDADSFFDCSRVFVAPLRYGAGMKGEIGQSMGNGLPVVSTYVGAEGMGLVDGETVLLANEPREFAHAVLRLYRDQNFWERLSENGRRHIEHHYSPDSIRPHLLAEIHAVRQKQFGGFEI